MGPSRGAGARCARAAAMRVRCLRRVAGACAAAARGRCVSRLGNEAVSAECSRRQARAASPAPPPASTACAQPPPPRSPPLHPCPPQAATFAFGSILEGPSVDTLQQLVQSGLGFLLTALKQDPNAHVKDTTAWTIGAP